MVNNPITKQVEEDARRGGGGGSSGELGADGVKVGGGRSKDQRGEKWEK